MNSRLLKSVFAGSLLAAGLALGGAAHAAMIDFNLNACPDGFTTDGTAKVTIGDEENSTAASACQYLTPADPGNVASISNINEAKFFGTSDWLDNNQTQIGGTEAGLSGQSGTWMIENADFTQFEYMIVFKGGPTNLTAFLFNGLALSGDWFTPFTKEIFQPPGEGKSESFDVSHLTIAKRDATPVPEPATLLLLGAGLLGLAVIRRRRIV